MAELREGLGVDPVPLVAFAGALMAVPAAGTLSVRRGRVGSPTNLILAGVAVANFFTAIQTFVQQQNSETLQQVFAWILGLVSPNIHTARLHLVEWMRQFYEAGGDKCEPFGFTARVVEVE